MTVSVKLAGLRTLSTAANEAINRGTARAAHLMEDVAKRLCPVDTGALRASIHVEQGSGPADWVVTADKEYAQWVEYGSQHAPAQPFMTPAMEQIDVELEIKRELQRLIAQVRP
jgi:HK97 gp10 family phage protein